MAPGATERVRGALHPPQVGRGRQSKQVAGVAWADAYINSGFEGAWSLGGFCKARSHAGWERLRDAGSGGVGKAGPESMLWLLGVESPEGPCMLSVAMKPKR
mmetsp:Transcript_117219/g.331698  ORF Transcript_117219/g.331698 Transcript_117219/m.331698 type:complete len:102 (-) Transcript_117219:73-378(-)